MAQRRQGLQVNTADLVLQEIKITFGNNAFNKFAHSDCYVHAFVRI